jgi:DNA-binding beta-propeller fold protein YncE
VASGCNQVAVIDAKSKLIMRYIPVGDQLNAAGHDIQVSGDGAYAYLSIYSGRYVQKIDTRTDTVTATADLGAAANGAVGNWSIIDLSPLDTALMVSGFTSPGYVVALNTASMQINAHKSIDVVTGGTSDFTYPHGIGSNANWDTFFVALQNGNVVNKYTFNPHYYLKHIPIKGNAAVLTTVPGSTPDPHQIEMAPDHSTYFVTCQNTAEVRVMDAHTDALLDSIPVGAWPQEMATCVSKNYLFVVCMNDASNPNAGQVGSVYVLNLTTHEVITVLRGDFNKPHDIAVDEQDGLLFICSTNLGGTAHHLSTCGGGAPNGWYTVYDLNTLQPADKKRYEALPNAYALAPRF